MSDSERPIEKFLRAFPERPVKRGDGWDAKCPLHGDNHASLSIAEKQDGTVLLKCHAGCETAAVCLALGLGIRDLFPEREPAKKIVATYPYQDEDGDLLFEVVRFQPKDFRQRRPDGKGGYVWDRKGVRLVPFRLPEVLAAIRDGRAVHIPEGEKDVLALEARGMVGTCNAGGVGEWREEFARYFGGATVVVIPDNDGVGRKHADDILYSLRGTAKSLKRIELPDLPKKGDLTDWFTRGGTTETFLALVESAEEWTPDAKYATTTSTDSGGSYQKNFEIEKIDKHLTTPPTYYVHLFGGVVKMGGATLANFLLFKVAVMDALNKLPDMRNHALHWHDYLNDLFETKTTLIDAPEEASEAGEIWHYVRRYIELKAEPDEATLAEYRGVYSNEQYMYFHGPTLHKYLSNRGIKVEPKDLWNLLREQGVEHATKRVKDSNGTSRVVKAWYIGKKAISLPADLTSEA